MRKNKEENQKKDKIWGEKKDILKKSGFEATKTENSLNERGKAWGGLPRGNQFSYGEKQVNTTNKY